MSILLARAITKRVVNSNCKSVCFKNFKFAALRCSLCLSSKTLVLSDVLNRITRAANDLSEHRVIDALKICEAYILQHDSTKIKPIYSTLNLDNTSTPGDLVPESSQLSAINEILTGANSLFQKSIRLNPKESILRQYLHVICAAPQVRAALDAINLYKSFAFISTDMVREIATLALVSAVKAGDIKSCGKIIENTLTEASYLRSKRNAFWMQFALVGFSATFIVNYAVVGLRAILSPSAYNSFLLNVPIFIGTSAYTVFTLWWVWIISALRNEGLNDGLTWISGTGLWHRSIYGDLLEAWAKALRLEDLDGSNFSEIASVLKSYGIRLNPEIELLKLDT
jgi:hypothetical protein